MAGTAGGGGGSGGALAVLMPGFVLGEHAAAAGYRIHAFDTIGSTNDEAMRLARAGDPGAIWIATAEQTAGRGRRGRRWETPKGNLGASCLTILDATSVRHAATLGFVAGLALHDALTAIAPDLPFAVGLDAAEGTGTRFALKWPNDVVVGTAKLAGIMLESEMRTDGGMAIVVGIGVNVAAAPDGLPYPVTSLAALGIETDATGVFRELSDSWQHHHRVWAGGRGLAAIRSAWLERAAGLGGPVALKVGERVLSGVFETIDEDGRLMVRTADGGLEAVAAAEVHFGAVASTAAM